MVCKDLDTLTGWRDDKNIWHAGEPMSQEERDKIWNTDEARTN